MTPPFKYFLAAVAALLLLVTFAARADDTVSWVHPTQYTDNSPLALAEIKSTTVRYGNGTTANPPTTISSVSVPAPATSVVVPRDPLLAGTVCYQVASVPVTGSQSAYAPSAWVCKTQTAPAPKKSKPPTGVTVQ